MKKRVIEKNISPGRYLPDPDEPCLTPAELTRIKLVFRPGRGFIPGGLVALAENAVERAAAAAIYKVRPNLLIECSNPVLGLFLLRCRLVPLFCRGEIQFFNRADDVPLWLWPQSTYVLAYERTRMETKWLTYAVGMRVEGMRRFAEQNPCPTPQRATSMPYSLWLSTPGGCLFQLRRFQAYQRAAARSLQYYLRKQAKQVASPDPAVRKAAYLGALARMSELPAALFQGDLEFILADPAPAKVFRKSKAATSRLTGVELNCWLREIWPAVRYYAWTYYDLQRVAHLKFQSDDDALEAPQFEEALDSAAKLEDRCKSLGLRLNPAVQRKVGAPTPDREHPPLADLAVAINGIGGNEAEWVWGDPDGELGFDLVKQSFGFFPHFQHRPPPNVGE